MSSSPDSAVARPSGPQWAAALRSGAGSASTPRSITIARRGPAASSSSSSPAVTPRADVAVSPLAVPGGGGGAAVAPVIGGAATGVVAAADGDVEDEAERRYEEARKRIFGAEIEGADAPAEEEAGFRMTSVQAPPTSSNIMGMGREGFDDDYARGAHIWGPQQAVPNYQAQQTQLLAALLSNLLFAQPPQQPPS